jgi:hypothetical protein
MLRAGVEPNFFLKRKKKEKVKGIEDGPYIRDREAGIWFG